MKNFIMNWFKSFFMSLKMFSIFPVPKNIRSESCMHLIIPNLPIVGVLIGLVWYFITNILVNSSVPILIQSSIILLCPFILSGFIHIDGYMDTSDAVFSWRDIDEKKHILKDSRVGAFAVCALVCLFLLQFSAMHTIISNSKILLSLIFMPLISRGVAGIMFLNLKSVFENEYVSKFKVNTKFIHTIFILITMIAGFSISYLIGGGFQTIVSLIATVFSGILVTVYLHKNFQGISGDLCGCIITVSEMFGLMCLAVI